MSLPSSIRLDDRTLMNCSIPEYGLKERGTAAHSCGMRWDKTRDGDRCRHTRAIGETAEALQVDKRLCDTGLNVKT